MRCRASLLLLGAVLGPTAATAGPAEPTVDVPAAIRALASPDPKARAAAAESLAGTYPAGTRAVPALFEARHDEDAAVREAVETTLRRFAERAVVDAAAMLAPESRAKYSDDDWAAVNVLAALGSALTTTDLAVGLEAGFLLTLAIVGGPHEPSEGPFRGLLVFTLDSQSPVVRAGAAAALSLLAGVPPSPKSESKDVAEAENRLAAMISAKPRSAPASPEQILKGEDRDPERASAWIATGVLRRSPWLGPAAVSVLPLGDLSPLASSSPGALERLRSAPWESGQPWESIARARALAATGAEAVARAQLSSADAAVRVGVAQGLAQAGKATAEAVAVLAADVEARRQPGWIGSLRALGRAGPTAKAALPVLERRWKEAPPKRSTDEEMTLPWALWRISPGPSEARSRLLAGLTSPREAFEAASLLAEADGALREVLPDLLAALSREKLPFDPVPLVDAIASLEGVGPELVPVLLGMLEREAKKMAEWTPPPGKPGVEGLNDRLRWMKAEGSAAHPWLYPRTTVSVLRALERLAAPSPRVEAALAMISATKSDVVAVAVARVRRAIVARAPR